MTKLKILLLIAAVILLTFGNSLTHDFIGDAKAIFLESSFYHSLKNLPTVFGKELVMPADVIPVSPLDQSSFTGCVSYRPVVALSFFADYFLFKEKPFGYRLVNVLLHFLVTAAFVTLVFLLTQRISLALLAGLLFATHPIQAEVVNNPGYRADLLASLFYVCAFVSYIFAQQGASRFKKILLVGAYVFSFCALFSKESALTLIFVLAVYDGLLSGETSLRQGFAKKGKYYLGFAGLWAFYLFVYLKLAPSAHYPKFLSSSANLGEHLLICTKIFYEYLAALLWPFYVKVLPPLYAPPALSLTPAQAFFATLSLALALVGIVRFRKREKIISFAILWCLINYLPVSNLVPLLNPFAYRFLYLVAMGFFLLLALTLEKFSAFFQRQIPSIRWAPIVKISAVALFVFSTLPLNEYFKNNIVTCREMVRVFPDSSRPYRILGMEYLQRRDYPRAIENFEKYLETPARSPAVVDPKKDSVIYHALGQCYVDDLAQGIAYFEKAKALYPYSVGVYADLSQAYLRDKQYAPAFDNARSALELDRRFVLAYVYAVHSLVELGRLQEARPYLDQALLLAPEDENVRYVKGFFYQRQKR